MKLRLSWVTPTVFIGGVINRVIAGLMFCQVDFISFAVPPAFVVAETVHLSVAPVPEIWVDQQFGIEALEKLSLKGSETVPHKVVKVYSDP